MEYYEKILAERISDLCVEKKVSEHKVSLDLGKSGAYIRGITSGKNFPSFKELLNIIDYFDMSPAEFFSVFSEKKDEKVLKATEKLWNLDDAKTDNVCQLIEWLN